MSSSSKEGKSEEGRRLPAALPITSCDDSSASTPMANGEVQKQTGIATRDFAYPKAGPLASTGDTATVEAVRKKYDQASSVIATAHKLTYTRYYNPSWTISQTSALPPPPPAFPLPTNALPIPGPTLDNIISERTRYNGGESHFSNYSTAHPRLHSGPQPGLDTVLSGVEMGATISSGVNGRTRMESISGSDFSQYSTMPSTPEPGAPKKPDWMERV